MNSKSTVKVLATPNSLFTPPPNLHCQPHSLHSPVCQQPDHGLHTDRTAGDYYDSSEDIKREIEGANSRIKLILAVKGMIELIGSKHAIAVSQIVNCQPVNRPAGKLMSTRGHELSSRGVVQCYKGLRDGLEQQDVGDMDVAVASADTMMTSPGKSKAFAEVVMREIV